MKVYHLIGNLDDTIGGPAKSVPYLVRDLNKLNIKSYLISIRSKEKGLNEIIEKYKLEWNSFPNKYLKNTEYSPALREFLIDSIKKNVIVILHVHSLWKFMSFLSSSLSKRYKVPLILSLRGSIELNKLKKKIAWKLYQKNVFQNSSVIHVTNKNDILKLRELGVNSPIALIPNGIDLDQFKFLKTKEQIKKKLKLKVNKKYILFLSRIHQRKGLKYLVNAWVKIAENFRDWDLLIVGPTYDIKYYNDIKKHINKFNLTRRVHFVGMLRGDIKLDYFNVSDLFVLPSYSENFGIAIAEAMAAKLPIITTQATPWEEINKCNAGWWVKLNQAEIDNALKKALQCNEFELKKKGINAYKLIQNYDNKSQSQKIKNVYKWVLGKAPKPDYIY